MPRWAVVILSVVAGLAIVIVLGFVFLGESDEGAEVTAGTTTAPQVEPATTTEETTTAAEEEELRITVRDGRPVGGLQQLKVRQGEVVRIRVESDVAEEIHVHGYDITAELVAGEEAQLLFSATLAGRFEIELEQSGTPVAELEVRP